MHSLETLHAEHVARLVSGYERALSRAELDAVVVHSGSLRKRSDFDDQYWPLRPTPHFQHWLPLVEADVALVVIAGKKPTLVRPTVLSFWEKPSRPETEHFWGPFDVVSVRGADDVAAALPRGPRVAFVGDDRARAAALGLDGDAFCPKGLVAELDALRTRKTPYEVHCLAEANRRAALGHEAVRAAFFSGDATELELHLAYLRATTQDDAETPYKNIVALGDNAATLHHVAYEKRARSHAPSSLLLDAGYTYQGYASDVTRTWVKGSGAAESAFLGLVRGVEAMQQRLCARVRVGEPYEALHDLCHEELALLLRDVGLLRCTAAEAVSKGLTRAFLPHGLGHSLGLQCHDVGCALVPPRHENPFLRNTSTIAEGQVFTIEPGVYFIDALLEPVAQGENARLVDFELVRRLAPLGGVRIEDDLLVGATAMARNLTREVLAIGGGGADAC